MGSQIGSTESTRSWPRLSVVTPSYNQAEFLEDAIQSVLSQGYPNLEYSIVDGGSSDGSVDIIKKYEANLSWWVSEPDRGQCHAINKGWGRATGDVLAYLNSDDIYLPGAFHSSVALLQDRSRVDLVYGYAHHIDEHGRVFRRVKPPPFSVSRLVQSSFIPQPTVFLRRQLYEQQGPLDESLHYVLDYEYWLRATAHTTPARLTRFTAAARYYPRSKTGAQALSFWREELALFDHLFSTGCPPFDDPRLRRLAYLPRLLFMSGNRSGFSSAEQEDALDRLREWSAPPSINELVSVIHGLDAHARSEYVGKPKMESDSDKAVDVHGILSAILEGEVVGERVVARACARLEARSSVRADLDSRRSRVTLFKQLLKTTTHDPGLLLMRGWWADIILIAGGRRVLARVYTVRDLAGAIQEHVAKMRRFALAAHRMRNRPPRS